MHPRNLGALALAAVLTLSACSSDDPEPKVAPTPSAATSSVATSPSTEPGPAPPPAATKHTPAGAQAFAAHFVDVLNYAQRTGHIDGLAEISDDDCAACSGYIDAIKDAYSAGGSVSGGQITHEAFRELPADYGAEWGGYAEGRSSAQTITRGNGEIEDYPGGPVKLFVYTSWADDQWVMKWMRTPS